MTDVLRLVSPEEFARAMTAHWRSLGNISSPKDTSTNNRYLRRGLIV
jgi:hypothetical protein